MAAVSERTGGRIANVIIIPMIAVVVLAIACVFGMMIWSSHSADHSAEMSQRKLLNGAIKLTLDQMARQQMGTAVWDDAYAKTTPGGVNENLDWLHRNVGDWLENTYGFSKNLIIDRDGQPIFTYDKHGKTNWVTEDLLHQLSQSMAHVRAQYIMSFEKTPSGLFHFDRSSLSEDTPLSEGGLVRMHDRIYFFSATAISKELHTIFADRHPPALLISFQQINEKVLDKIGGISGLRNLRLTETPEAHANLSTVELNSPLGKTLCYLQWQVNRPGTEMLTKVSPLLIILALAIAGLMIGVMDFTRQTTKKLASSRAEAIHTAKHDSLSGLPNRAQFNDMLSQALEKLQEPICNIAVIYIDLDRFKEINDTLGHAAGDKVIQAVADRLQAVTPENGVIARISGDEFAMLLRDCPKQRDVEYVLTKIHDQMASPVKIGTQELFLGLSMGVALSSRDGEEPGELIRKADIALYDAKGNGRGRWSFFDPSMQEQLLAKDKMSRELRRAIDENRLHVAYQPQSDPATQRIVAVETLARWIHPDFGMISPSSFIPLAEETGLINDLGMWVLRQACRDAHRWPDLIVSVNISPTQFKHPQFVEKILQTLKEYELPPERLELEVTENVFAGQHETILTSLKQLKDLGVKVALDDFGSGYSSLSYLRKFPFDTLKIDQDFISNINQDKEAQAILTTIIDLGTALGMMTVAEGVEEREQLDFLARNGCGRIQGYYISHPLKVDDLDEFIEDSRLRSFMDQEKTETSKMKRLQAIKA